MAAVRSLGAVVACRPPAPRSACPGRRSIAPGSSAPCRRPAPFPARLGRTEVAAVLACLHEDRFQNCAPAAVYATLLTRATITAPSAHVSSLGRDGGSARAARAVHASAVQKPELLAPGPNQLWSWDITKLKGRHMDLLLPLCPVGRLQPLRGRLASGATRERRTGEAVDRRHLRQAGHRAGQLTVHADAGRR